MATETSRRYRDTVMAPPVEMNEFDRRRMNMDLDPIMSRSYIEKLGMNDRRRTRALQELALLDTEEEERRKYFDEMNARPGNTPELFEGMRTLRRDDGGGVRLATENPSYRAWGRDAREMAEGWRDSESAATIDRVARSHAVGGGLEAIDEFLKNPPSRDIINELNPAMRVAGMTKEQSFAQDEQARRESRMDEIALRDRQAASERGYEGDRYLIPGGGVVFDQRTRESISPPSNDGSFDFGQEQSGYVFLGDGWHKKPDERMQSFAQFAGVLGTGDKGMQDLYREYMQQFGAAPGQKKDTGTDEFDLEKSIEEIGV